ncbi:hypothetical protein ACVW1B_006563 [Bradyrhizobium sp. USDA 4502]
MSILRHFLIVASLGTAAFLAYICLTETVNAPWTLAWFITACVLNVIYLGLAGAPNGGRKWRIFGLLNLWLDAKESELKARSARSIRNDP